MYWTEEITLMQEQRGNHTHFKLGAMHQCRGARLCKGNNACGGCVRAQGSYKPL